ncbi:Glycosyltransferase involved in cell wall bisynthesis [Desulfuromusa kysingii]|uniref:Glycosyltransferase involved in cell wall bisynthesis n=1 Tax=Desulfuromusa kysingii TaxID=37625 RepID=A0A1H3ZTR5_9BACT|nr:glycosyltransferase [Desulfuromusa kysingii]SEA26692.1 Glycosyltransferase involved in cell wall bisynthesis [Desulfuromusa kysingii]
MAQVDLHVHSKYSNHPSEWFLQRLGASESYTEPETIYKLARKRGMDLVTVTDHNRIKASLELVKKHPQHCFSGVESTAYFPEDNCKVHILIYGLDREQFSKIQKKRLNIYKLRDYLKQQDLPCIVAHATYSVNGKLRLEHLEKLILLFNNFEGRNGSRSTLHNDVLSRVLLGLTAADIERLQRKHLIEPWGAEPWKKALTGGSDDHAGFFIGKTSTQAEAKTPDEFLQQLRLGQTQPQGRQNDFQGLTFAIYKIAFDFSQHKSTAFASSTISDLSGYLFNENKKLGIRDRLRLNKMKSQKNNAIYQNIVKLIETSRTLNEDDIDARLELLYDCISDISDQYFRSLLTSLNTNIEEMDIIQIIQGLSSSIPGIFLSIPFFSAFKHMFGERELIQSFERKWGKQVSPQPKRILWLTDTLTDLNGVSMTLQTVGKLAEEKGHDIHIMASLSPEQQTDIPSSTLVVPPLYSFQLPHYEDLDINVPSVLHMLKQIYTFNPDEIYISTPGPVGILGLLIGRMLGTEIKGIYHTDFTMESEAIIAEPAISNMIEQYSRWFFNQVDTLLVPSSEYIQLLKQRGYRYRHMERFKRGLRTEHFKPQRWSQPASSQRPKLLYVGRISKDKNLDFLLQVYLRLHDLYPGISLTFAGEGPYLQSLQDQCRHLAEVRFLGRVAYADLPQLYNQHDLFVFPSVTDTFGMAVLEAQACGLPALVSNVGGPKEIVVDGGSGYVLPVDDVQSWVERISLMVEDFSLAGGLWQKLGQSARDHILSNYSWDVILKQMVAPDHQDDCLQHRHRHQSSLKRILKLASNMMVH